MVLLVIPKEIRYFTVVTALSMFVILVLFLLKQIKFKKYIQKKKVKDTVGMLTMFFLFFIIPIIGLFFYYLMSSDPKYTKIVIFLGFVVLSIFNLSITILIKKIIKKTRPDHIMYFDHINGIDNECFESFPSGHSSVAFSVFSYFLSILCIRNAEYNIIFFYFTTIGILCSFVAASRVVDRRHHILDIIGGVFIGVICTVLVIFLSFNAINKSSV